MIIYVALLVNFFIILILILFMNRLLIEGDIAGKLS